MQKNTIIISTSLVLLGALLIYNNSQDTTKETENPKQAENINLVAKTKKTEETVPLVITPEILAIPQEQEPIIAIQEETIKETPQKKYTLSRLPDNMSIAEKKQRFNELLIPAVTSVYNELEKQYKEVQNLISTQADNKKIQELMKIYNASDEQDLLKRLRPHPKSITLAQSAMQTGWLTSRFTFIASNFFGIWSFDENEPRIQARETRDGKAIYVKKYASIEESVKDYYKLLGTSPLFEEFREQRMKTNDPFVLIQSLDKYYKDGDDYTKVLSGLIKYNKFDKYDKE